MSSQLDPIRTAPFATRSDSKQRDRKRPPQPFACEFCESQIHRPAALGLLSLAIAQDERLGSVNDLYDGNLPLSVEVNTFRHIDRVFPSARVPRGSKAAPLPRSGRQLTDITFGSAGQQLRLADYIRLNRVSGLLVLKDGQIALERYELGNTPNTRWVSFSVVKSITSTLAGAALKDGSSVLSKIP